MIRNVLGIDLGGTKILAVVETEGGATLALRRYTTPERFGPEAALNLVAALVDEYREGWGEISSIGIGFPGLTHRAVGTVRSSVILEGWMDVPFAGLVTAHTGIPCEIDNDVNMAARAELLRRRDDPYTHMLFVSIGTGIGGAIVIGEKVIEGAGGLAGEIGHLSLDPDGPLCRCGRRGCVGPFWGGAAVASRLGLDAGGLADAVGRGEASALKAVSHAAAMIGHALASALNVLNPDLVVFGGGMSEIGQCFLGPLTAVARREALPEVAASCRFERAIAGYEAGALGAAQLAREALALAAGHGDAPE